MMQIVEFRKHLNMHTWVNKRKLTKLVKIIENLLCVLTSKWVLCQLFAVKNHLFWPLNIFSITNGGKIGKKRAKVNKTGLQPVSRTVELVQYFSIFVYFSLFWAFSTFFHLWQKKMLKHHKRLSTHSLVEIHNTNLLLSSI